MSKRRLADLTLRTYPREIREARGQEMVGTLLDAGDASLTAFAAQLASVIVGGLRARSRRALAESPATIACGAICWAAVIATLRLPFGIGVGLLRARGSVPPITVLDMYVMPLIVLALFTVRRPRLAACAGLAWLVLFLKENPIMLAPVWIPRVLDFVALPAAGFTLMFLRPRTAPSRLRGAWIVPAAASALLQLTATPMWELSNPIVMISPLVVALALLPWAPGFVLATAVVWAVPDVAGIGRTLQSSMPVAFAVLTLLLVAAARRRAKRAAYD
jgi:hypothetical protein